MWHKVLPAVLKSEAAVTKCSTIEHYLPVHQHLIPHFIPVQHGQTTANIGSCFITVTSLLLFTTATLLFVTARAQSQYVVECAS